MAKGLFRREAFTGFGPDELSGCRDSPPVCVVRGSRPSRLRAGVRSACPRSPGVYGMVDSSGELIYIGKAKSLRARLLSYFRPRSRDPKAGRIVQEARHIVWERSADEFAALLRELELIRRWQPRHNVQGQPRRRRRVYVCVGRAPAPYVFVAGQPPRTATRCFGPVPGVRRAGESVRQVNNWFGLRDCPQSQEMVFADQQELFPVVRAAGCLRHEIGSCLGPCAGACTAEVYARRVRAAVRFLEGRDSSPLERLERDMMSASAREEFERAAVLRDRLEALGWLSRHLGRLREGVRHSFVYPVSGADGLETWYLIRDGRVRAAVAAPRGGGGGRVEALLAEVYREGPAPGTPGLDEVDGVLLVAGWFRKHPEEWERGMEPAEARARLGG